MMMIAANESSRRPLEASLAVLLTTSPQWAGHEDYYYYSSHLAAIASNRATLEQIHFARCILDVGMQEWGVIRYDFTV